MPLSTLRPLVAQRFHEVNSHLAAIAATESPDPLVPDSIDVRIMRGLFFVHLYGAFEYSMDQSFIRLAQHISSRSVSHQHLNRPVLSVAMDPQFTAVQDIFDWSKKYKKRLEIIGMVEDSTTASIRDTILSSGMQSVDADTLTIAFSAYGIIGKPFVDLPTRSYIDEVVQKRHAVAHGRESPITVGNVKSPDLRIRYDALLAQTLHVMDQVSEYLSTKKFVVTQHRSKY